MAARSPIQLDSSPAPRPISITPQQRHDHSSITGSSSPTLEPLSAFFKPSVAPIKPYKPAQSPVSRISAGFASAATLWKANCFENQHNEPTKQPEVSDNAAKRVQKEHKKSIGKLGKAQDTATSTEKSVPLRQSLSHEFGHQETAVYARHGKQTSSEKPESQANVALQQLRSPSIRSAEAQHTTSANKHHGDDTKQTAEQTARKPRKPGLTAAAEGGDSSVKKVRRKAGTTTREQPVKRSKKRFAKSESIILNSDEPDPGSNDLQQDGPTSQTANPAASTIHMDGQKYPSGQRSREESAAQPHVASETSNYFNRVQDVVATEHATIARPLDGEGNAITPSDASPAQLVPRRRLSWTPARDTVALPTRRPSTANSVISTGSEEPIRSLAMLVSGFEYSAQETNVPPLERTSTGESLTKRRRIDLADAATVALSSRKESEAATTNTTQESKAKKKAFKSKKKPVNKTDEKPSRKQRPPKVKAVKKKPQTITALATKDYQPAELPLQDQATVSEFFAAQKDDHVQDTDTANIAETPATFKKPRKPRAKKAEGATTGLKAKASTAKPKKGRVKITENNALARLYSPERARAEETSQGFLFGTSSQLAADDSPSTVRNMRWALRESEVAISAQDFSRVKVPDGHGGTTLSVKQAERDLWCTSCRTDDGGLVLAEHSSTLERTHKQSDARTDGLVERLELVRVPEGEPLMNTGAMNTNTRPMNQDDPLTTRQLDCRKSRSVVDLCLTSPMASKPEVSEEPDALDSKDNALELAEGGFIAESHETPNLTDSEDSWMLLKSDDTTQDDPEAADTSQTVNPSRVSAQPEDLAIPSLKRSATSPMRYRTALQTLDANIGLSAQTSPLKDSAVIQTRAYSSRASRSPGPRPRGRPRKGNLAPSDASNLPKRQGRPAKVSTTQSPVKSQSAQRKLPKLVTSASQPAASSSWADIDEISDSEDAALTPSPPRRRATSSPPTPQELTLGTEQFLPAAGPMVGEATSHLRPGDSQWSTVMPKLFSQIIETVRSTPPSTDMSRPTWHEKILLYDPIVLEDLTAWLNAQGIRYEFRRLKQKAKTKGRKKKDTPVEEPEYETCAEEIKPWMVQKWCEDKSICCLWKEGLRGGVRTRY